MTLGDRIVVLADGRIQQVGRPIEVYRAPVNRFVAGFIGTPPMNFVEGRLRAEDGGPVFLADGVRVRLVRTDVATVPGSERVTLGIRPEDLIVDPSAGASAALVAGGDTGQERIGDTLVGRVILVERLGGSSHVHFEAGPHRLMASVSGDPLPEVGACIAVRVWTERAHLFDADGRALVRASAGDPFGSRRP
jgi:ABC-type sugar transport system ATPase subunit